MWPFKNIENDFNEAFSKIKSGQRPFEDPIFDLIDVLIKKL